MKKLLDKNVVSEVFIQNWFDKAMRLDKDSDLYDKKAEKKFRDLITDFVTWMQTASGVEGDVNAIASSMNQGQEDDEDQIKDQQTGPKETDAQRKQREAIEKQAR